MKSQTKVSQLDFRTDGTLAEWLRRQVVTSPGVTLEDLIAKSDEAPRSWRVRTTDPRVIARNALRRIRIAGEIEVIDGRVFPTRRLKVRPSSN